MKTLQLIIDDYKKQKHSIDKSASGVERFLNAAKNDIKIERESSKNGNLNEINEARNYSKQ